MSIQCTLLVIAIITIMVIFDSNFYVVSTVRHSRDVRAFNFHNYKQVRSHHLDLMMNDMY
jgi:hypothetical protein